jgi:hypothetical protein
MQDIHLCQSCKAIEFEEYFRKSDILEGIEVADTKDFPFTVHHSNFTALEESSSRCGLCRLALQILRRNRTVNGQVTTVPTPDAVVYVSVMPALTKLNTMPCRVFTLEFSVDQLDLTIIENIEGAEGFLGVQRLSPICAKIRIDTPDGMLNAQKFHPLANRKLRY